MKNFILFFSLVFIFSCKTKQVTESTAPKITNKTKSSIDKSFIIKSAEEIDKQDLMFNIQSVNLKDSILNVKVQYGGGCVTPHIFKLVTEGVIDDNGNMHFYLLHKTHNDKCKALILKNESFNLKNLYKLKSNLLKTITINDMKELPL